MKIVGNILGALLPRKKMNGGDLFAIGGELFIATSAMSTNTNSKMVFKDVRLRDGMVYNFDPEVGVVPTMGHIVMGEP